jgi:alpha-glucosidase
MLSARGSVRRLPTLKRLATSACERRVDPSPMSIGEGIGRFRDPAFASVAVPPFPGFAEQPRAIGSLPIGFVVRPTFSTLNVGGAIVSAVEIRIEPGTSLYGTGEQAGTLLRNGTRKVCWNTDIPDYSDQSPSLYQSHPWVLAVRPNGSAFGVICETTWRCVIDLSRHIRFEVEGPSPAVTVIERGSAKEVVEALAELTGKPPMPPLWALGFHQCRYSYFPDTKVREVASQFRERSIPCDVIWLDIDYMEGYRCFTFSKKHFPKPKELMNDLHADGFKVVCMIDPGIKVDAEYPVYAHGAKAAHGGHFVKNGAGQEYHGVVWPGDCAFPDFTSEHVRKWWGKLYEEFMSVGIDGVWNDMNEPAVFGGHGPGKTMPWDNQHAADGALGGRDVHGRYHNVYGMQMIRATREGVARVNPKKRPFVLTRANFLGGQRYGATWTGDNRSDWRHLAWSVPMALNLGLSGQAFAGPDIGGFLGNADAELFARWMGIGTMLPFARAHTDTSSGPHEPWSFGEACEATCRRAIERRYRLLPYWYTVFAEASRTGAPIVRPMWFADATDARLRGLDNAFLIGDDVLVWTNPHAGRDIAEPVLPRGGWKELELGEADADLPQVYLRQGAAIALAEPAPNTAALRLDELTVAANFDHAGSASGELYLDEGDGHGHEHGQFALLKLAVSRGSKDVAVTRVGGTMERKLRLRVEWVE